MVGVTPEEDTHAGARNYRKRAEKIAAGTLQKDAVHEIGDGQALHRDLVVGDQTHANATTSARNRMSVAIQRYAVALDEDVVAGR